MNGDTCATCAFSRENDRSGELECHRNPPASIPYRKSVLTVWPDVTPDNWCGAHSEVIPL